MKPLKILSLAPSIILLWIFYSSLIENEFFNIRFNKIGEIECFMLPTQRLLPVSPRIYEFKGEKYLTYYDYETRFLFLNKLNSSNKIIRQDTINLHLDFRHGFQNLMSYYLISPDSLLVSYNTASQKFGTHDSSIVLISSKGKFLATINMNDAQVTTWKKVPSGAISKVPLRYQNPYFINNIKLPLIYDRRRNAVITTLARFQFDSPDVRQYMHKVGLAYLDGRPFQYIEHTNLLDSNTNLFYGMDTRFLRGCYNYESHELILGTGISGNLVVIDSNLHGRPVKVHSVSLDTVYPLINPYKEFNDYNQGEFLNIIHNTYDNTYLRMIRVGNNRFAIKRSLPPKNRDENETFVCQILNKDLSPVGEGSIPDEYGYPIPYSKGIVLFFNKSESRLKGKLVFDVCRIEYENKDEATYLKQLSENINSHKTVTQYTYNDYVKNIVNRTYKYYLIINMENTCQSCKDAFVSYYLTHRGLLEKQTEIAIIILTSNYVKERSILGFENMPDNFYVDDKGIYKSFIGASEHISWLSINSNKPIVKHYLPDEMYILYNKINILLSKE